MTQSTPRLTRPPNLYQNKEIIDFTYQPVTVNPKVSYVYAVYICHSIKRKGGTAGPPERRSQWTVEEKAQMESGSFPESFEVMDIPAGGASSIVAPTEMQMLSDSLAFILNVKEWNR